MQLRGYQEDAVKLLRPVLKKHKSSLLVIPTGGGKTVIFSYLSKNASLKSKKVLILVHRVELLRQTAGALSNFDVDRGLINPLYTPNLSHNVQVASVQTISNRKRLDYLIASGWVPDMIIIDEAHHATAGSWRKVVDFFPEAKVIGVTATPIRADGQGLGREFGGIFDDIVVGVSVQQLIDMGYLVKPRIFSSGKKIDLSEANVSKGDYNKDDLARIMDKPTITGDAVAHYTEICPGAPAVVFCVNIAHAEHTAELFRAAGYRFYAVDGTMDDDTRKKILGGLEDGNVQGVCSCDLISEGTDIPAITCAILLRPTQSLSLYLQQVGRALRICEGKLNAIILDHVGNVFEHGFPQEEREWSLEGIKKKKSKKKEEPAIRVLQCLSCFAVHEPAPVCPECGHVYPKKESKLEQVEGKLEEITQISKRKEQGMAQTLEDLQKLGASLGHKPGWARKVFEARQNKKIPPPPPSMVQDAPSIIQKDYSAVQHYPSAVQHAFDIKMDF